MVTLEVWDLGVPRFLPSIGWSEPYVGRSGGNWEVSCFISFLIYKLADTPRGTADAPLETGALGFLGFDLNNSTGTPSRSTNTSPITLKGCWGLCWEGY